MDHRELNPNTDTTQRQPVRRPEAQIRLLFEKFQAFVDEYRPKISLGGVFIATAQPKPVGTAIACEFKLADGFRLCQALGDVLWIRPQATAPDRPAGMGIRFKAIDDDGRKLILKILEEQLKSGGEPFEVERIPDDAATCASPATSAGAAAFADPGQDPASTHARPAHVPPGGSSGIEPVPTPQDDPASTHRRRAVSPTGLEPIETVEPVSFDAVEPLDGLPAEPVEPQVEALPGFNAPWGVELPGVPEDVIEPVDEEFVIASVHEEFSSDPKEAEFPGDADRDLFEFQAPDTDSLGSPPDAGGPFGEFPELGIEEAAGGVELPGLGTDELPEFELVEEEVEGPPDSAAVTAGPSLAGLDDTLSRSLPDDGPELGTTLPSAAVPAPATATGPSGLTGVDESLGSLPGFADMDEPLVSDDGGFLDSGVPDVGPPATELADEGPASEDSQRGPLDGIGPDSTPPAAYDVAWDSDDISASDPLVGVGLESDFGDQAPIGDAWSGSDADDEWEEEASESGVKGFWRDFQLTVSEAKGRIAAVIVLLVVVGAGLVFKEQVLDLVGLGSQGVPRQAPVQPPALPSDALPSEGLEGSSGGESPGVAGSVAGSVDGSVDGGRPASASGTPAVEPPPEESGAAGEPALPEPEPLPSPSPPPRVVPSADPRPRPASAPATSVVDVDCQQTAQGTRCVFMLDGELRRDRFEHLPLGYAPLKEQITIRHIRKPYRGQIEVGTLELDRVRTGLHGDELKLVFDLSSERMTLSSIDARSDRLEVLVSRRR